MSIIPLAVCTYILQKGLPMKKFSVMTPIMAFVPFILSANESQTLPIPSMDINDITHDSLIETPSNDMSQWNGMRNKITGAIQTNPGATFAISAASILGTTVVGVLTTLNQSSKKTKLQNDLNAQIQLNKTLATEKTQNEVDKKTLTTEKSTLQAQFDELMKQKNNHLVQSVKKEAKKHNQTVVNSFNGLMSNPPQLEIDFDEFIIDTNNTNNINNVPNADQLSRLETNTSEQSSALSSQTRNSTPSPTIDDPLKLLNSLPDHPDDESLDDTKNINDFNDTQPSIVSPKLNINTDLSNPTSPKNNQIRRFSLTTPKATVDDLFNKFPHLAKSPSAPTSPNKGSIVQQTPTAKTPKPNTGGGFLSLFSPFMGNTLDNLNSAG
jgi:hypothetical protein